MKASMHPLLDPESPIAGAAIRMLGAFLGVLASIIIVAPEGTQNALFRMWVGITMGAVMAPVVPGIWFLGFFAGDSPDLALARAAFAGFSIWFVLELTARLLSASVWTERLLRELIRIRGGGNGGAGGAEE